MNEIIYGIHVIESILEHDYTCLKQVYILKGFKNKRLLSIIDRIKNLGIIIQMTNKQWMNKKTNNAVHQGIIAQIKLRLQYQENDLYNIISKIKLPFLLILDRITDPYNLGACLRTAEIAGVNAVIIPKYQSASLNATTKKVSCGASERIPLIIVTNLVHTLRKLQKHNIWIIGTTDDANHILYNSKLTGPIALIMGSEGNGIRRLTKECCNELIRIPTIGMISSLNVSVATGICLFEAMRQRYNF
ncbi:MAG: 23S rRNA (guanosine(2251)-2'-O)-methyltransferase RlmB [Arsenophonus endosymbiont of Ceratovacuna japonica]